MRIAAFFKDSTNRAFVAQVMGSHDWRFIQCETLGQFAALCASLSPPEILLSDDVAPLLVAGGTDSTRIYIGAPRELPPGVSQVVPGNASALMGSLNTAASVTRLRRQFNHADRLEPITRLPRHTEILELARRYQGMSVGIVVLQLDHGEHLYADLDPISKTDLLGHLADFLQAQLGADQQLGFFDATCFLVLLPGATEQTAQACAESLVGAFRPGLAYRGSTLHLTASAGYCVEPRCIDPENAWRTAWAAKMQASRTGGNRVVGAPHSSLGDRIPEALQRDEFSLVLQAQWSIDGEHLAGVEALLRWQGMEVGELAPSHFIPIAEQTGQMARIGDWVIERACCEAATWLEHLLQPIVLAVNVSPQQFEKGVINQQIQRLANDRWLNPQILELELTHEQLLWLVDHQRTNLYRLRDLGVRFAIDGLGATLIEADKLLRCPADTLKLDRTLVGRLEEDPAARALARELCALGERFSLRTVGVGVETPGQLAALRDAGCTNAQGYLMSMPVPLEGFQSFLARRFRATRTGT
ncbi:MAG: bifunctional diguanylate cyclase/phosphodiesterase [Pseudomonadales bacterium]